MWLIDVERRNGDIWLGKRLNRFTQSHKIQFCDSVYLKYKGENVFKVLMFGVNEVQYGLEDQQKTKIPVHFASG